MNYTGLFLFFLLSALLAAGDQTNASVYAIKDEADFFSRLNLDLPELASARKAVEAKNWPAAKQGWAHHLATRTSPQWRWNRKDREPIRTVYQQQFGGLSKYTNAADRVLARDFDLLGVRKQLEHKPLWLHGPIEWTHVLSRFGYWQDMGRAYWGTGNPEYAKDFVFLLRDWIESNPVPDKISNDRHKHGSVWRTLETGIRAQGWFDTMELFMEAPEFDAEAKYLMTCSLLEHAGYLQDWVVVFRAGNWQVCEAAGLATLGIMLPEFKAAPAWRDRGFEFLVQHMQKDVGADGFHWELTPGYHSWVMREFMDVAILATRNNYQVPGLTQKLEKMFEVLQSLSLPDGKVPPIGDAGTGGSVAENLGRGALFFKRPDFRHFAKECDEDYIWTFGADACERFAGLPSQAPKYTSVSLPDARYLIMRTGWDPSDKYLLFDCAPWRGGHSHHDRLQVSAYAGRDLIVDSGMCSYDQPLSRELRKATAHNVLLIDSAQLEVDPEVLAWHTGEIDFGSGRIQSKGLTHQRSVLFVKPDYWVVVDHVAGQGEHEITRLFHFPAGPVTRGENYARTSIPNGMNIFVQTLDSAVLEMRGANKPTGLVEYSQTPVAAFVCKVKLPVTLCTILVPFSKSENIPNFHSSGTRDEVVNVIASFPSGNKDQLAIGQKPGLMKLEQESATTQALCLRTSGGKKSVFIVPP